MTSSAENVTLQMSREYREVHEEADILMTFLRKKIRVQKLQQSHIVKECRFSPETPRTSQHCRIEGFKGGHHSTIRMEGFKWGPHSTVVWRGLSGALIAL